ncbi:MAG: DUF4238 domain-containing protein [Candidatus Poribacteria bacterium]|nr:DUF4238 domain-containing protein [Candidatus Poribacteria bacterium]
MHKKIDNRKDYIHNHFVPEFYLKNFTFDGNRCWIIRNGKIFSNSISTIAYEDYLNSHEYEIFLGKNYEKIFSECINQMLLETRLYNLGLYPALYSGCWDFLFDFVAFMWSHNKYTREMVAQEISDNLKQNPKFSSVNHDIRCNDFYAQDVFESIRNAIAGSRAVIRVNNSKEFGFITSDNPCQIARVNEDLLRNINSPEVFEKHSNFANNVKGNYNVQVLEGTKIVGGKININLDDDSILAMPLTHDIYLMMFKNQDAAEFVMKETSFLKNDIRYACNQFTSANKKYECYSKIKDSLSVPIAWPV